MEEQEKNERVVEENGGQTQNPESLSEEKIVEAPAKSGKLNKKKKVLLGCFGAVILFLLVSVAIILYILSAVFDDIQPAQAVRVPDALDLQSVTEKLFATFGVSIGDDTADTHLDFDDFDFGKVFAALTKPGKLTLSKGEVNALIDVAFTADRMNRLMENHDPADPRIYGARFENGRFYIKITVDSRIPTPYGSYCNFEVEFIPQVIDHHLQLDLCSAKVGSISCPVSYLKGTIDSQLRIYEQTQDGKELLEIITSLEVENEKVVLKYDFQRLSFLLLRKAPQIQQLGNSSDRSVSDFLELFQ